jgi:hypothetical protein
VVRDNKNAIREALSRVHLIGCGYRNRGGLNGSQLNSPARDVKSFS